MKRIETIREIQLVELEILKKTVRFLEDNNLTYILCGGTMLGAVRHGGFIPWDDDVDLLVPRKDYDRLLFELDTTPLECEGLKVLKPGDDWYRLPFIKVVDTSTQAEEDAVRDCFNSGGLWVDIFPMDHFPDSHKEHVKFVKKNKFWCKILASYTEPGGTEHWKLISRIVHIILYFLCGGSKRITRKIDSLGRKLNSKYITSDHMGNGARPENIKNYYSAAVIENLLKRKFEDSEFFIPQDYEAYLVPVYGNYMEIPPEDKRRIHHVRAYRL